MTTKEDITMGRTDTPVWTREPEVWENGGLAGPEAAYEITTYYAGPNGATVGITFWIRFVPAEEVNFPIDAVDELPEHDGERGLFAVEEVVEYRASDDPDGQYDDYEHGEGSSYWYWSLDSAVKEARRLAGMDWSSALLWDGKPR